MKKKIVYSVLVFLTVLGTLGGRLSGVSPFYNEKGSFSLGINFGIVNEFAEGSSHNGINISFFTRFKSGSELNGINISVWTEMEKDSKINGVNLSALSLGSEESWPTSGEVNGLEIGLYTGGGSNNEFYPFKRQVNGFQIGLWNQSLNSSTFGPIQIGCYNQVQEGSKYRGSIILNH